MIFSDASFTSKGHPNIRATHKNTFEFTKDNHVTPTGDCLCGVESDFDSLPVSDKELTISIDVDGVIEKIRAWGNPEFSDDDEFVVRKTDFISNRTYAINADKACIDFSEEFREKLKDPNNLIKITIENVEKTAEEG